MGSITFLSDSNLCAPTNINPPFPVVSPTGQNCNNPTTNDVGFSSAYPDYFLGASSSYTEGAAQGQHDRNTALYLFAQDSWKIKTNLTLNYGLRWELNTPYADTGNRLQTFRPGEATTQYPCWMSPQSADDDRTRGRGLRSGKRQRFSFPYGLVFPGDKGVPRGLTTTYLQSLRSAHRSCVESLVDRWLACEAQRRPGEIERPRRLWHLLQSDRAARPRAVQRRASFWRQHVAFKHALQFALRSPVGRAAVPESLRRSHTANDEDPVRSDARAGQPAAWIGRNSVRFCSPENFSRI